ncbi:translation initiation factor eIF4e [Saccharata proteae CBS 121410]|uniref:Translation initiation factor eIF4e n=1 Tax=Saccharata proteae CBS 121410 TaxID=1314787 RepID=A0A9P4HQ90_9PEZI|nr:translation initiation factor eIF4e [Saccharata proteae CBS 121410]
MANPRSQLGLATSGIPAPSEDFVSATQSPARGKEMKAALLHKLRPPALTHAWDFWHDRQNRATAPSFANNPDTGSPSAPHEESASAYEERLVKLESVTDVRMFWSVFNNFNLAALQLRDTIHFFHKGVKPLWEDPRNVKGGAWTFRVPKEKAPLWWQQICLLAIGEVLQGAVDNSNKRMTFIDDICGLSYSVRFTSILITVWNRDAENKEGIERLRDVIFENMGEELHIKEGSYFYKKHSEHAGFSAPEKPQ